MTWIKIDRDENGFATEECLKDIHECFKRKQPIMFVVKDKDGINYECLSPAHDIYDWLGDIELHPCFIHYLPIPIPKLEV